MTMETIPVWATYVYHALAVTGAVFWTSLAVLLLVLLIRELFNLMAGRDEPVTFVGQVKRPIFLKRFIG